MSKRKFTGKGPLVSCKDCGRDTQGKFGYCFRCSGGGGTRSGSVRDRLELLRSCRSGGLSSKDPRKSGIGGGAGHVGGVPG